MLDFADVVAVNKYDQKGSEDAIHDVRKQIQRNRVEFNKRTEEFPVYGTIASRFNDDGVTTLYAGILEAINTKTGTNWSTAMPVRQDKKPSSKTIIIPPQKSRYLSEIADTIRRYHIWGAEQVRLVRKIWQLDAAAKALREDGLAESSEPMTHIRHLQEEIERKLDPRSLRLLGEWDDIRDAYSGQELVHHSSWV